MENTKKKYTPEEVAVKILKHVQDLYKSSNLYKANTAHEIEPGQEPVSNDTECPEQLAEGENVKNSKKDSKKKGDKSIPEHEEGLSPEEKEAHDATESMSDEEEMEQEMDAEAHERDEEDADFIEEEAELPSEKEGNEEVEEHLEMEEKVKEDEEEDEDEEEAKKKQIDKVVNKSEQTNKAVGLKSPKLQDFMKNRSMKKGKTIDMKTRETIADESGTSGKGKRKKVYTPEGKEKPLTEQKAKKYKDMKGRSFEGENYRRDIKEQNEARKKKKIMSKSKDDIKTASDDWMKDRKKYSEKRKAKRNPSKDLKDKAYRKKTPKKAVIVDKERANKKVRRQSKKDRKIEKMLGMKEAKQEFKKPEIPKPPKVNEGY